MNEAFRLLYAEDNPQDADLLRAHFEHAASDFYVEVVDSGAQCLERLVGGAFDMLLLDNRLPDMDGLDVLTLLRAKGMSLPVVMVTGIGDDEIVGRALRAGASDYVAKTGDYQTELPGILRGLLKRQRSSWLLGDSGANSLLHILYVEPNAMDVELAQNHFSAEEPMMQLHSVASCEEALRLLSPGHGFDLVLTDLRMPGMDAQEFIHAALHRDIALPFIVITGRGDEAAAVNILRLGAYDYILKREGYLQQLPYAIRHALQRFRLDQSNQHLRADLLNLNASLEQQVEQRTAELRLQIRELIRTERALLESERRFRKLFENSSDAILLVKDGKYIDCNAAAVKLFAYIDKQPIINSRPSDHSPDFQEDGRSSAEKAAEVTDIVKREGAFCFDWLLSRADGSIFYSEVTITAITIGGEEIFHTVLRDISERVRAREVIQRLSRVYRMLSQVNESIVRATDKIALFANICNVAVQSDLFRLAWVGLLDDQTVIPVAFDGAEQGYMAKLNIRLDDEITGQGPTATALKTGEPSICQDIATDPRMAYWREAALERGYRCSGVFPISSGGEIVGAVTVYGTETDFFTPDIVSLMLELAADVSFSLDVLAERGIREQAEEQVKQLNAVLELRVLERTAQLQQANRELEAFSYSVSHDLRAPLRSIDGFSQLLIRDCAAQLDETGLGYVQRVSDASQRMGVLIDELLMLSQVTLAQLNIRSFDMSAMAADIAAQLQEKDPARRVRFTVEAGMNVKADANLMRVVLTNLLGNAWKFTGKKAQAVIEFGSSSDKEGQHFYFVRDNGAGFDMEYAEKLFQAFQRLHGENEFEGTGVGLATVQRIVQRHHGHLWASARPGMGATFCFTLP